MNSVAEDQFWYDASGDRFLKVATRDDNDSHDIDHDALGRDLELQPPRLLKGHTLPDAVKRDSVRASNAPRQLQEYTGMSNQTESCEKSYDDEVGLELTLQTINILRRFVVSCDEHRCL